MTDGTASVTLKRTVVDPTRLTCAPGRDSRTSEPDGFRPVAPREREFAPNLMHQELA